MKATVTLPEDGALVTVDVQLPAISVTSGLPLANPDRIARTVAEQLVPALAKAIAPKLPPAALPRKHLERDASGRLVGLTEIPAIPPPAIRAHAAASALVPAIVAEYAASIRGAAARALVDRQRKAIDARLDELQRRHGLR